MMLFGLSFKFKIFREHLIGFGDIAVQNIQEVNKIKLKRKIIEDNINN